jgi:hypothetical protein
MAWLGYRTAPLPAARAAVQYGVAGAADALAACARELEVKLVVMGKHQLGLAEHMLSGSVTENVVRHAPCPVLAAVTRAPTRHQPESAVVSRNSCRGVVADREVYRDTRYGTHLAAASGPVGFRTVARETAQQHRHQHRHHHRPRNR